MNRPLLILILMLMAVGCASKRTSAPAPAPVAGEEPREPVAAEPSPLSYRSPRVVRQRPDTLLASGTLPLVHLFDAGGPVRIIDATSKTVLHQQFIPPRTIIGVSATGILIGREKVLSVRLLPDHRYELWWEGDSR